jgi:uncharacterized protein (TIGR04255 family)
MFEGVKIPKKIESPITEAVFQVRFVKNFPGDALYGILFEIFKKFPNVNSQALPVLQIPQQMRDADPNLLYQPYYRAIDNNFIFSVGPQTIIFSSLQPYSGWSAWIGFMDPILDFIKKTEIIRKVEGIGLRTIDIFDKNIFEYINAGINICGNKILSRPSSFFSEFEQDNLRMRLNVGNTANIDGVLTDKSLVDIDCIYPLSCDGDTFFVKYKEIRDKMHLANKKVFFGLLQEPLIQSMNPEY